MRLSNQIEGLISNFERVIDGFLAGLPYERLVPAIQKTNTTIDVPVADLGLSETECRAMVNWDKSVDLLIAGSGGGGMAAALAAIDSGIEPLIVEKQALVGGSTGTVRRHGVAAEQPADAGGGHTRFARGRPGVLRRRRRRHR